MTHKTKTGGKLPFNSKHYRSHREVLRGWDRWGALRAARRVLKNNSLALSPR